MPEPQRSIGRLVVPAALVLLALLVWLTARTERQNLAAQLVEDVEKAAADPLVRTSHVANPLPGSFGERVDAALAETDSADGSRLLDAARAQSAKPPRGLGLYAPPDLAVARRLGFWLRGIERAADTAMAEGRAADALRLAVGLLAFARDRSYFDAEGARPMVDGAAAVIEKAAGPAGETERRDARAELQRIATGFPSPLQLARYRRPCVRARALGFVLDTAQRARIAALAPKCVGDAPEPQFLPLSLRRVRRAFADHDDALLAPPAEREQRLASLAQRLEASGDPLLRAVADDSRVSLSEDAAAKARDAALAGLLQRLADGATGGRIDPPPPAP